MQIHKLLKLLLTAITTVVLFACKHKDRSKEVGYVYHEKWRIPSFDDPNSLKAEPLEIKRVAYNSLADSSFDSLMPVSYYELFRFDRSGNIVFRSLHRDSLRDVVTLISRGPDGPNYETSNFDNAADSTSNISKTVSVRLEENKFKTTRYHDGKYESHSVITFLPEETVVEERWVNDAHNETIMKHYAKDRVVTEEIIREGERFIDRYYYSGKGFLDSVISFDNYNRRSGSRIYQNNQYGDAVLCTMTDNDSIGMRLHMKYEYDQKGNWIKQLIFKEIGNSGPKYHIVIRDIKY